MDADVGSADDTMQGLKMTANRIMFLQLRTAACVAALCGVAPLLAQTEPKPAAKAPARKSVAPAPAARPADGKTDAKTDGKTLAIGGGKANAGVPILTRDELRACMGQDEAVRTSTAALEARRAALDKDKLLITADQQGLQAERAPLDDVKRRSDGLNGRVKAYSARLDVWNQQLTEFNAGNRSGNQADRERDAIARERDALQQLQKDLDDERVRLSADGESAVRTYNAKAGELDARAADWNQRNQQLNQAAKDAEVGREAWMSSCADRRYREDDEAAIRRGK